jgi:hypothetical protein
MFHFELLPVHIVLSLDKIQTFICVFSLFSNALSSSDYVTLNDKIIVNDELEKNEEGSNHGLS